MGILGLTSPFLAAVLVAAAILLPLSVLFAIRRVEVERPGTATPTRHWRIVRRGRPGPAGTVGRWIRIVLAQFVAILAVLVLVNNSLHFYLTWSDLVGGGATGHIRTQPGPAPPSVTPTPASDPPHPLPFAAEPTASGAELAKLTVRGEISGVTDDVWVWLPPGYRSDPLATQSLPVLYLYSGFPGSPQSIYEQFQVDKRASQAIANHTARPFIVVMPSIMTHGPRDTECVDLPDAKSETFLADEVPKAVQQTFRISTDPQLNFLAGFSTGGLCAANYLMRHPDRFGAAASLGGYFHPFIDGHDIFNGDEKLRQANSPLWQAQNSSPRLLRLLIVSITADPHSYDGGKDFEGDSKQMIEAVKAWPGVGVLLLDKGGHGWQAYGRTLDQSLTWLGQLGL